MRVSMEEGDPGYRPVEETRFLDVYLDGELQNGAVMADEEAGLVKRYVRRDGRWTGDLETVCGQVRIAPQEGYNWDEHWKNK